MNRTDILSKEVRLTKCIAPQDYYGSKSYFIEIAGTKDECHTNWFVYRIEEPGENPLFYDMNNMPTEKIDKAMRYIAGHTKWDHCSNFSFVDNTTTHICGLEEINDINVIFAEIYNMAKEILGDKWDG